MAHWGRTPANTKVGGAEFVANFTGIESWRLITGRTPGITCAQLRQWLVEGMAAATEVDASGGAANVTGLLELQAQVDETRQACLSDGLVADAACNGLLSFELNCEDYPEGLALFNQEDSYNCGSWVLVLAANAYDHNFMWVMMVIAMLYTFLGVNIVADVFMSAIEVITAQTKEVKKTKLDGTEVVIRTKVWNPTVANLSLMALGSSAPEIMLAVLDTINTLGEVPGEMGPSTIVGSAAFNLFVISAVVVCSLPEGETKKIEEMEVFAITATASILAYLWMVIVLMDENVSLGEAVFTFCCFPLLLGLAFAADRKMCCGRKVSVTDEMDNSKLLEMAFQTGDGEQMLADKEEITKLIKERQAKEGKSAEEIAKDIVAKSEQGSHSRNHYRINAMKSFSGQRRALPSFEPQAAETSASADAKADEKAALLAAGTGDAGLPQAEQQELINSGKLVWIFARSPRLAAFENEGSVTLIVERMGALDQEVTVDYATEDETATAGEDYEPQQGQLVFPPKVTEQTITVPIIDDDQWEPDETFFIQLMNPQCSGGPVVELRPGMEKCTVTIIDDDEPGVLGFFETREYTCSETCGKVELTVIRKDGADGIVTVQYATNDGASGDAAQAGLDYISTSGTLVFANAELSQTISVDVIDTGVYDKSCKFSVVLTNPGGGALVYKKSGMSLATVTISNDGDLANTVNTLTDVMNKRQEAFKVSSSSWREQFIEAFECEGGVDADGNDVNPSATDYFFHFATIGWKVLFAFIPPTDYCSGWATFFVSLIFIGVITALVGAFAGMFGCFVGLPDSITAITFVALGTSLPDTFASMHAAKDDSSADAAIGNVTGSNSVNVFLGLGLPWLIASIHAVSTGRINQATGEVGYWVPKGAGLSFSVFIFCVEALVCITGLLLRHKFVGGELGGSKWGCRLWGALFLSLWFVYITLSIMIAKKMIAVPSWL